ncbi:MAG: UvrB/UvrC motif-containing protein [Planctomycetota bacterium]
MSLDIGSIVEGWPYEPGKLSVRRVLGEDGREKIQLRLDLGILQMETSGRPDGRRPHGYESYLAYYKARLVRYCREHGGDEGFRLSGRDCELLRNEMLMYYHRYLSEFALDEYDAVIRDTTRNIESMDLCTQYAVAETDQIVQERFRPYIIMMRARARALEALKDDDFSGARVAVQDGLEEIREAALWTDTGEGEEESVEVQILETLLEEISEREPVDPVRAVETALDRAVAEERYEDAARYRDQLRIWKAYPPG